MTRIAPTVLDVSRAIAELDEYAVGHPDKTINEMRLRVATNLGDMMDGKGCWPQINQWTIGAIMYTHGATPFTVQQHASVIASLIQDMYS